MLLRISLIIAILAGIGTIVVTQMQAKKQIQGVITERNDHIRKENEERAGRKKAETNLASTSNLLNQTKATLAKTEESLSNTKQQVATLEATKTRLETELKSAVDTRNAAQQELARWAQTGTNPEGVIQLREQFKTAQDAIAALDEEKKIVNRQLLEWKNKYLALIGPDNYEPPMPPISGKIMAVDPKWNFVVLNVGKDKGLLEHGVLLVHRQSKYIGKVRISEVMENRAIANVMPGTSLDELQEGDRVLN
jgi:uncharacterized protein HemX